MAEVLELESAINKALNIINFNESLAINGGMNRLKYFKKEFSIKRVALKTILKRAMGYMLMAGAGLTQPELGSMKP